MPFASPSSLSVFDRKTIFGAWHAATISRTIKGALYRGLAEKEPEKQAKGYQHQQCHIDTVKMNVWIPVEMDPWGWPCLISVNNDTGVMCFPLIKMNVPDILIIY